MGKFLILTIISICLFAGCNGGIHLTDLTRNAGIAGSPTSTTIGTTVAATGTVVTSGNTTLYVRMAPISYGQAGLGNRYDISDPFLEAGIQNVISGYNP